MALGRRSSEIKEAAFKLRVDDNFLNSVVFLCIDELADDGTMRRVPKGTAFIIIVNHEGSWVGYVITAAHNLEAAGYSSLYLRVNATENYDDLETNREDWFVHDRADIALVRFPGSGYNLGAIGLDLFIGADYVYRSSDPNLETYAGVLSGSTRRAETAIAVETGNEIFFVGLFVQAAGRKKNLPIARFGTIARMPIEPVTFERSGSTVSESLAYLAECGSWGGHSGSPVFWRQPIVQYVEIDKPINAPKGIPVRNGKVWVQNPSSEVIAFLGVVSGHFEIDKRADTTGDVLGNITTSINSGIAVVTPAEAVRELLMRDDVIDDRVQSLRPKK